MRFIYQSCYRFAKNLFSVNATRQKWPLRFEVVSLERYNLLTYDDDDGTGRNNKMIIAKNSILKSYLAIKDTKKGLFAIFLTIMIVLVAEFVCFSCWSYFCLTYAAFLNTFNKKRTTYEKYYHKKVTGHFILTKQCHRIVFKVKISWHIIFCGFSGKYVFRSLD